LRIVDSVDLLWQQQQQQQQQQHHNKQQCQQVALHAVAYMLDLWNRGAFAATAAAAAALKQGMPWYDTMGYDCWCRSWPCMLAIRALFAVWTSCMAAAAAQQTAWLADRSNS
jgi:hypothetical protein